VLAVWELIDEGDRPSACPIPPCPSFLIAAQAARRGADNPGPRHHSPARSHRLGIRRLTLLSPTLVEVILEGRQPEEMALEWLMQEVPWSGRHRFLIHMVTPALPWII
jgi:hypothetical protein